MQRYLLNSDFLFDPQGQEEWRLRRVGLRGVSSEVQGGVGTPSVLQALTVSQVSSFLLAGPLFLKFSAVYLTKGPRQITRSVDIMIEFLSANLHHLPHLWRCRSLKGHLEIPTEV